MDYKTKYLKYKTKYLNLSRKIQTGGRWNSVYNDFFGYGNFYINSENENVLLVLDSVLDYEKKKDHKLYFSENMVNIINHNTTLSAKEFDETFIPIYRNVLFDIDSTIINSFDNIFDSYNVTNELKKKIIEQLFDGYKYIYRKLTENGETMFPIYNDNILLFKKDTGDMYIKIIPYNFEDGIFRVPENIDRMDNIINEKTCVFNLGTLFYFILSERKNENLYQDIYNNRVQYKDFSVDVTLEPLKDLTFKMLCRDPNDRPTFDMIHNIIHPTPFKS